MASAMASAATILPDPTRLHLLRLSATAGRITAVVETLQPSALCPLCGGASTRVHSRYVRRVADLPGQGVAFRLQLHAPVLLRPPRLRPARVHRTPPRPRRAPRPSH
jgi:zinc-finger of transposase IS204/IS1001/IS1096/IS1165